jgi:valyl-tRNA synthetase
MIAKWPKAPERWQDAAVERSVGRMQELVRGIREIRNQYMVDDRTPLDVVARCPADIASDFTKLQPFISQLAGIGNFQFGPDIAKPPKTASKILGGFDIFVSLAGLIDPAKELSRLEKQLAEKSKLAESKEAKLSNESFTSRAPAEVVQQERDAVAELRKQIAALHENIRDLKD